MHSIIGVQSTGCLNFKSYSLKIVRFSSNKDKSDNDTTLKYRRQTYAQCHSASYDNHSLLEEKENDIDSKFNLSTDSLIIPLEEITGITVYDGEDTRNLGKWIPNRIAIVRGDNQYSIRACSIIIIQLILDLDGVMNEKNNITMRQQLDWVMGIVQQHTTCQLTEIIDSVETLKNRVLSNTSFKKTDLETIIKINYHFHCIWLKILQHTNSNLRGIIKNDDGSALYTMGNLSKDLHAFCTDYASKYLHFPSEFATQIIPMLLNVLRCHHFIHHKIQCIQRNIKKSLIHKVMENGLNTPVLYGEMENALLFKNDISAIVSRALGMIVSRMRTHSMQSQTIGISTGTTELIDDILKALDNHQNIFKPIVEQNVINFVTQTGQSRSYLLNNNTIIDVMLRPFSRFVSCKMGELFDQTARERIMSSRERIRSLSVDVPAVNVEDILDEKTSSSVTRKSAPLPSTPVIAISPMAAMLNLEDTVIDVDGAITQKPASLKVFVSKTRKVFQWFTEHCGDGKESESEALKLKIDQLEAKCFDEFIASELYKTADKLEEIEEAIALDNISSLDECCYDAQDNCYFGTSIISVINLLDPIMGKIDALPMQQHHILQLSEFFTSTAAHYVISISGQINHCQSSNAQTGKSQKVSQSNQSQDDKLYILCGTLHKFKVVLRQYLDNVSIVERYKAAAGKSRCSSITRFQREQTILDKLNCAAVFNLISVTLEETASKLAVQICNKAFVHQRLTAIIWKQPINEPLSNQELRECMKKYIWNQMIIKLKDIQKKTTTEFFDVLCFEAHRSILKNLQSALLPLATTDVLTFVQVLRVKYALNSVVLYMTDCWKLDKEEVMESSQVKIISEMVQLSLSETQSMRKALQRRMDVEQTKEIKQICGALRVLIQARTSNTRTRSAKLLPRSTT